MDHIIARNNIGNHNSVQKTLASDRLKALARRRRQDGKKPRPEAAANRKLGRALQGRLKDFELLMNTKNVHGGAQQRKDTGGFHKPGSNQH